MSEWRNVTLADISDRVDYGYTASASEDPALPRLLRITDIAQTHLDWSGVPGCPIDGKNLSKYKLATDDIVVARTGATVGYAKRIRTHPEAVFASYLVRFRLAPEAAPSFVGAIVESSDYKRWVQQNAGGAAQPNASAKVLSSFPLRLPDKETQVRIGAVFDTIADLIENNRRRIEVLEEMARAIYREWFVKFRYPGHEGVPMVDSALGLIPEGWEVQPLAAIATVNGASRKPGGDEVFRYLDISALSERHIGELEAIGGSSAPGRARRVVSPGDTVWATVRPNRRAHALLVAPDSDWIASTGLAVLTPSTVSPDFLFETSSATAFSDWLVGRATGSAYPAVRATDFEEAPIVVPDAAVDAAFADKVSPMHDLSWRLRNECSRLAALRDLLLPKLVTGQIDISTLDLDALVARQVA